MKPSLKILSWVLQLVIVYFFAYAAYQKLLSKPNEVALFELLGMEPVGRYVIGFLEAVACVLLLLPRSAVFGAILALGIMLGALIAHLTKLGYSNPIGYVNIMIILFAIIIIYIRKNNIPSVARMIAK